ncbi:MAG: 2,3-bisphosphoglycerate-independent phosphoglycerate mutase [Candidatus Micrarchaeota archaeon]
MKNAILLIIDGLGDLPTPQTPLQAAKKPNLDRLAEKGITGLMSSFDRGVVPGSDTSHLNIFGYDPLICYSGRGPLEALGIGMKLEKTDLVFRANFATMKDGKIIDRRAGRIATEDAKKLEKLVNMKMEDVEIIFKSSVEHRGALILRGHGLSNKVTGTDRTNMEPICVAFDNRGEKTARILNEFTKEVHKRLSKDHLNKKRKMPANVILARSGGFLKEVPSLRAQYGMLSACISGGALYKGCAKLAGMDIIEVKGATGTANTNLKAKGEAAIHALKKYDFIFLHVKACDSFGHDGDFKGKTKMIERIDKELVPILAKSGAYLVITSDHSTPCSRKTHSGHEVPIIIYGKDERIDDVKKFDEISCMKGGLGHMKGRNVMPLILNLIEKAKKYGS